MPARPDARLRALASMILGLLALAVYARTLQHPFVVYDDPGYVLDNPLVTSTQPGTWQRLWDPRHPEGRHLGQYAPVRDSLFRLEYQVAGARPLLYHLTNVLLHVGCTVVLLLILLALEIELVVAFVTGVLFAIHPVAVEVVAWVSGRKDSLGLLCCLCSLALLLRAARASPARAVGWAVASVALWLSGVLAKPTFVVWPILVLAIAWARPGLRPAHRLARAIGLYAPVALSALPALFVARAIPTEAFAAQRASGLEPSPWVVGYALVQYALALFWPSGLAVVHPSRGDLLTAGHSVLWSLPTVALCALGVALAVRRHRAGLALYACFVLPLLPVLNLLPNNALWADRFLYLPRVVPSLLAAWTVAALARSRSAILRTASLTTAACLGAILYVVTLIYVSTFESTHAMWSHAARVDPRAYVAQINLAVSDLDDHLPEDAIGHYRIAMLYGVEKVADRMATAFTVHARERDCTCVCRALAAGRRQGIVFSADWPRVFGCDQRP